MKLEGCNSVPLLLSLLTIFKSAEPSAGDSAQSPLLSHSSSNVEEDGVRALNIKAAIQNAPQIFNSLHASMRQWDSSVHHNGMSFFPASVPANTLLYHGTNTKLPVRGMEWLAFEIEHAELFAHARGGGPPPKRPPGKGLPGKGTTAHAELSLLEDHEQESSKSGFWERDGMDWNVEESLKGGQPKDILPGYLHTYKTSRRLDRFLYIDGMSAGKCSLGTLDTQDYVLLQNDNITGPIGGDFNRARGLCNLLPGKIDGFIRMEAGFEIILCNFTRGVEFMSAFQRPYSASHPDDIGRLASAEYMRGVGMRYQGIGGGRVDVDYSRMVSAYFYDFNFTNPNPRRTELPRLPRDDENRLRILKNAVLKLFETDSMEDNPRRGINWQSISDMIVTRYSSRLAYLAMDSTSTSDMLSEIDFLLTHFIDYNPDSIQNITLGKDLCVEHYLVAAAPLTTTSDHLIKKAISEVSRVICSTLFDVRGVLHGTINETASTTSSISAALMTSRRKIGVEAKHAISRLMHYLSWPVWRECGGRKCAWDEICFIAMWPMGMAEDHFHPGCRRMSEFGRQPGALPPDGGGRGNRTYWDFEGL